MNYYPSQEELTLSKDLAAGLLAVLVVFTYFVLRLIEIKNARYERMMRTQNDGDNATTKDVERAMEFTRMDGTFFETEDKGQMPILGVKANIRICVQALATVGFSCHTSAVLPISFIGIMVSCGIIHLCLWQKQLKYKWMSEYSNYRLLGTLFFIVCASTTVTTLLVWAIQDHGGDGNLEVLQGYIEVFCVVGVLSLLLGTGLIVVLAYQRYQSSVGSPTITVPTQQELVPQQ